MSWFEALFGFREEYPTVNSKLRLVDDYLVSTVNNARYYVGAFSTPSVAELQAVAARVAPSTPNTFGIVASTDVSELQADPLNRLAVFQVASQFNCLEFLNQHITPENGVSGYARDRTQGPAAAVSCGPAAVFRNYFVFGGEKQQRARQLDLLHDVTAYLGTGLYVVRNGYVFADNLVPLNARLSRETDADVYAHLRVGVHESTQVTSSNWGQTRITDPTQCVAQVLCSALSVRYNTSDARDWERFARIVLVGAYTATICQAIINRQNTGCNKVFLAPLGGSAFGNDPMWICDSIRAVLDTYANHGLDITLVAFRNADTYRENIQKYI